MYLAKLEEHTKSVVDVRIVEHFNAVISVSKDEVTMMIIKLVFTCVHTFKTYAYKYFNVTDIQGVELKQLRVFTNDSI